MSQNEAPEADADNAHGLIPEIYYDLIARVASGVPLVLAILIPMIGSDASGPSAADIEKLLNITSFLFLIGLGYVAGHFLTSISTLLNFLIWTVYLFFVRGTQDVGWGFQLRGLEYGFRSKSVTAMFADMYERIDWAARRDSGTGTVLKKMEAGAALTDNLLAAWIVLLVYEAVGGKIVCDIDWKSWRDILIVILITALLVFSVGMRRVVFVTRQDRILQLLGYPSPSKSSEGGTT